MSRYLPVYERAYDNNGKPLDGAKLFFYETGTSTLLDTYSDQALTTANTNPVIADSQGQFGDIFLANELYRVELKDNADVTQPGYPVDNVASPAPIGPLVTATVTDIATLKATAAINGSVIYVQYYAASGDFGGGTFKGVTGAAPGTYTSLYDDGIYIKPDADTDGSTAYIRDYTGNVDVRWFGATGYDTRIEAIAGGVDSFAKIQAAIDSLPAGDLLNANIDTSAGPYSFDGGGIVALGGKNYIISDTPQLPPNVILSNGYLVADTGATWTDETGLEVDKVTVTAGGTGYTQDTVSVAFSGGGGSGAAAEAIVQNGAVIAIWMTVDGTGYTSAPTVTISDSGAGAGATATSELIVLGQPMVSWKVYNAEFNPFEAGLDNVTLFGEGVADGARLAGKNPKLNDYVSYNAKHVGLQLLGVDTAGFGNVTCYSSSKYGVYASYRWGFSTSTTTNEVSFDYLISKFNIDAQIRTSYCNAMFIAAGNLRSSTQGIVAHLQCPGTGHNINIKTEHKGESGNPAYILAGMGHKLGITASSVAPSQHYKWVINLGQYNTVEMHNLSTVMNARVDNVYKVNDISPFMSTRTNGLYCTMVPASSDARLAELNDWCRDMDGNDQTGPDFIALVYGRGRSAGLMTEKLDISASSATTVIHRKWVSGDTLERLREYPTGERRYGDGTATQDVRLLRTAVGLMGIDSGVNVGTVQATVATTSAALLSISNAINTEGKFTARMVWDATLNKPLWATSSSAGSTWRDATGAVIHTPV
jgi:hypothetical protein